MKPYITLCLFITGILFLHSGQVAAMDSPDPEQSPLASLTTLEEEFKKSIKKEIKGIEKRFPILDQIAADITGRLSKISVSDEIINQFLGDVLEYCRQYSVIESMILLVEHKLSLINSLASLFHLENTETALANDYREYTEKPDALKKKLKELAKSISEKISHSSNTESTKSAYTRKLNSMLVQGCTFTQGKPVGEWLITELTSNDCVEPRIRSYLYYFVRIIKDTEYLGKHLTFQENSFGKFYSAHRKKFPDEDDVKRSYNKVMLKQHLYWCQGKTITIQGLLENQFIFAPHHIQKIKNESARHTYYARAYQETNEFIKKNLRLQLILQKHTRSQELAQLFQDNANSIFSQEVLKTLRNDPKLVHKMQDLIQMYQDIPGLPNKNIFLESIQPVVQKAEKRSQGGNNGLMITGGIALSAMSLGILAYLTRKYWYPKKKVIEAEKTSDEEKNENQDIDQEYQAQDLNLPATITSQEKYG